ncbi:PTS transporter subunit EIIC [Paenibacillus peoriae]|uniref:PTS transporter subunit EIIC n=1 Tax=Paenibacillus peoriae TaxID=59893 RepID=UPI00026C5973|nr:PTS transporter subunit EIIC [Paenibacillus peoriae]MEC0180430.1 PTS transporter subunit EIIC [Paenibacillus peoriae]
MNQELLSKETPKATIGGNTISRLFDFISGVFTPILPAMIGAGMIKAVIYVLMSFGFLLSDPPMYTILLAVSDGLFYFLPIFVAASAARRLGSNVFVAAAIGASVFHPQLTALLQSGEEIRFAGLSVIEPQATSSIILILVVVWMASYVEKWLDRYIPCWLKLMAVPTLTLVITISLMMFAFGPLWNYLGEYLSDGFGWLFDNTGVLAGLLLGGTMAVLIIAGMQYIMIPIMVSSLAALGYDQIFPVVLAATLAQAGAAFGVLFKSKNGKVKTLAFWTGLLALLGVTEPAMYGVAMRFKKPFVAVLVGGALGGAFMVLFETKSMAVGGITGLLSLGIIVGPTLVYAIWGMLISFVSAGVITYFIGFKDVKEEPHESVYKKML